jgi:hypothetical protein
MECLPPPVAASLRDVVETHALFFMSLPDGVDVHEKMLSGLTGTRKPNARAAAGALINDLAGKSDVLAEEDQAALADDLGAALGTGPSAEIGEVRLLAGLGNALLSLGKFVWKHKAAIVSGTVSLVGSGYAALSWAVSHEVAVSVFLKAYQGPYAAWFKTLIEIVKPWI